jgi:hypothetical protein
VDQQRSYQSKLQTEIGIVHNWRMKVSTMHSDKQLQSMYAMNVKDFTLLLHLATFRIMYIYILIQGKITMVKKWNVWS